MGVVVPRVEVEQENVFDAIYTINHNKILIDGHASARKSEICRHCCPLTGNDRFMPHCLIIIQIALHTIPLSCGFYFVGDFCNRKLLYLF